MIPKPHMRTLHAAKPFLMPYHAKHMCSCVLIKQLEIHQKDPKASKKRTWRGALSQTILPELRVDQKDTHLTIFRHSHLLYAGKDVEGLSQ